MKGLFAQYKSTLSEQGWIDSVFSSLSDDEKIGQLMIIRAHSNLGAAHVAQVTSLIENSKVGALIFFQGGPIRQALLTNYYQSISKTPLLISIDGEYGLGMRLDSVTRFPYQSTLGALTDSSIVYNMGIAVGEQMKRIGVHINYAPTVDINSNPRNPVIGYRSFGEDKFKVARFGVAYAKGMQQAGIMASAKHFPGHGDTEVDSHVDLPVIRKSRAQLDSLELYPFKKLIEAGVGSVMSGHLYIPAIDKRPNRATSLSKKNVTDLLKDDLGFTGLAITDALEMKGVTKFFPSGEAAVQSLLAGNDMLCLPDDVPAALAAIKKAIREKHLKWVDIDDKVKKVLRAKYQLGLNQAQWVDTTNLLADLNRKTEVIKKVVARNAITVLRNAENMLPLQKGSRVAYVAIGTAKENRLSLRMQQEFGADVYFFSFKDGANKADAIMQKMNSKKYDDVIVGIHDYSLRPSNNYGISIEAMNLWGRLNGARTATFVFGNAYALQNFCTSRALVAMYQDDDITQEAAADFLIDASPAKGKLPVSVCQFPFNSGISMLNYQPAPTSSSWMVIDSIVVSAILQKAFPGAVVLAAKGGEVKYFKAFGNYEYGISEQVTKESIFDLASVTKISATTVAVMKLYEEGKLDLNKTISDYLPWVKKTDKAGLKISDILMHQAGLVPFIPFYKETLDAEGKPLDSIISHYASVGYTIPVAQNLFLRSDWSDTLWNRILKSPLTAGGRYIYSDNDFLFLGKIVEEITEMSLAQYVDETFYKPLNMVTTGFRPFEKWGGRQIVPTEAEGHFRGQLLHGYVHDEGASLFGGVAGHAGLFSDAFDLLKLYQMLLNGGEFNGIRFFKPETIKYFTAYHSKSSRRGLGFDKPEKDNNSRRNPYPSLSASPEAYGHTGYTGTCVWVDPKYDVVYIFLSNRVYPTRNNNKISQLDVRSNIQEVIYKSIKEEAVF